MKKNFYPSSGLILNLLLISFLIQGLPLLLSAQSYKILPLGNSITQGTTEHPSYRDDLYQRIKEAYVNFTYVGSKTSQILHPLSPSPFLCSWEPIPPPPPLAHEAHWGWRADELLNGRPDSASEGKLSEWLQGYTPDVVLMHVGTNDMIQNQSVSGTIEELREIVRILRQDNPKVIILMAKLFPVHAPVVGATASNNIDLLNSQIPPLVQELHTTSSPVLLVDQNTGFDPTPGVDTYDGIHPRGGRVWQMARRWHDVLSTVLVSYTTPPAVEIAAPEFSTVHKVGQAIPISAEAWDREETVERVEFFVNCEKVGEDFTSPYEISWTPTETGSYRLTAEATDGAGARAGSLPVHIDVAEVVTGKITRELWENVQGTSVSSIPVSTAPASVTELTSFEAPSNAADNYGQRIRGYLTAPATGEYTFWIASDDYGELWLSTSADPGAKVKRAYVNGWTKPLEWGKYRSQQSVKVQLEVGKRYYIEALHLENGGGDNLAVGWQLPNGNMERPIPGHRFTPFEEGPPPPPATTYNLAVSVAGLGSVTPANGTFLEDDVVLLKATPAVGYKFSGWSGDAFGANNPQPVVMHKNMNVTATFTRSEAPTSLVSSVTSTTGKAYALAELAVGAKAYTDRTYQATSVPASMGGATLIQTPNDDKKSTEASILSFYLSKPATVYVAYDPRATALPSWLSGWQKLTDRIGVNDSKISHMDLYSKSFATGIVRLGGNLQSPAAGAQNNYFVVVREEQPKFYSLSVSTSGSGTVTKSPEQESYASGTNVSITATPAAGYRFTGWSGDTAATANPLTLAMDGSKAITANFASIEEPGGLISYIHSSTGKTYSLEVLKVGVKTYTDRTYQVTSLPVGLSGASIVQTPNDDKWDTGSSILSFNLNQEATVYVAYDPRATALPSWLSGWQKLTDRIGVNDSKISHMDLYSKSFPAGIVRLGGNLQSPAAGAQNNYFVVVKPASLDTEVELLKDDFNPGGKYSSVVVSHNTNVNGVLFFCLSRVEAGTRLHNITLWKSDGTAVGTVMVKDFGTNQIHAGTKFPVLNGNIFFRSSDPIHGWELWKSDGTAAGTAVVKDIYPGGGSSSPLDLTVMGNMLYFSAKSRYAGYDTGYELWKSDGTAAGTVMVKEINSGSGGSGPVLYNAIGSTLYFQADDGTHGYELWKTDGTAAGTVMVKDINPGSGGSYPIPLEAIGTTLYFKADDGTHGNELWKTDGTAAGTVMVKDFTPGSNRASVTSPMVMGSTLYLQANDGTHGYELWKTDGTAAGTVMVKDINPGSGGSGPVLYNAIGSTLYFQADDGTHGYELWKTDGTAAGTVMVKDINLGSVSSFPYTASTVTETEHLVAWAGNMLYFPANNGTQGKELWETDGTAAGTVLVKDIFPGTGGSNPRNFTSVSNSLLFFTDSNYSKGYPAPMLWKYSGEVSCTPPTASFSAGAACAGGALTFTDGSTGVSYDATYAWDMDDDGTVEYTTKGDISHTYATAGTYTARLTVTQGPCSSSYTQTVTIHQTSCQQVVSVSLIDAGTKKVIQTITDGATLNLATLPTQNLNFRVSISPATVGSVEISLSGAQSKNVIENIAPYDLFGDEGTWPPAVGNYTLKATPYTASKGSGTAGVPLTVSFSVISGASGMQIAETAEIRQELDIAHPVLVSYPNPFTDKIIIAFSFPVDEDYELEIYSPDGGLVDRIGDGRALAGQPVKVAWEPALAASGLYIIRLATRNKVQYLRIVRDK